MPLSNEFQDAIVMAKHYKTNRLCFEHFYLSNKLHISRFSYKWWGFYGSDGEKIRDEYFLARSEFLPFVKDCSLLAEMLAVECDWEVRASLASNSNLYLLPNVEHILDILSNDFDWAVRMHVGHNKNLHFLPSINELVEKLITQQAFCVSLAMNKNMVKLQNAQVLAERLAGHSCWEVRFYISINDGLKELLYHEKVLALLRKNEDLNNPWIS